MSHAITTALDAVLAMASSIAPLEQLDEPTSQLELCRQLEACADQLDRESSTIRALVTGLRIAAEVELGITQPDETADAS